MRTWMMVLMCRRWRVMGPDDVIINGGYVTKRSARKQAARLSELTGDTCRVESYLCGLV